MTASLEDQRDALQARVNSLQQRLDDINKRIHKRKVRETGLAGRIARSLRVPQGILIEDVAFTTWAPDQVYTVSGFRLNSATYTTIHTSSRGYQLDDPDPAGVRPQPPGVPG